MTEERQTDYEISDRDVQLYYFTVHEVSGILKTSPQNVRRTFRGKMIWFDGRWMISPSDIQQMRKHETHNPAIG